LNFTEFWKTFANPGHSLVPDNPATGGYPNYLLGLHKSQQWHGDKWDCGI